VKHTSLYFLLAFASAAALGAADAPSPRVNGFFTATAYSQQGKTASGDYVHRHVVAADPDVLPIGSRIKVKRAGRYSGEYVVADTGEKIQGRRLDIFIPSTRDCQKFGRKRVRVTVIQLGDGTHAATKQADVAVKQDVKQDLSKDVVGNAATETDWAVKQREEKKGVPPPVAIEKAASAAAPAAATDAPKNAGAPPTNPQ
jgi:3D (Asp-Asp-Asp) domain-containing protein